MAKATKQRNLSPETRQKLSKAAKERHERGEFGGSKFGKMGGRPRKPRVTEILAERALEHADLMEEALVDGMSDDNAPGTRIRAVQAFTDIVKDETKLAQTEQERDAGDLTREQMIEALKELFADGPLAEIAEQALGEESIVDVDVVEEEDGDEPEA